MNISTMFPRHTQNVFNAETRLKDNMSNVYAKNLKTNFLNLDLTLSLDASRALQYTFSIYVLIPSSRGRNCSRCYHGCSSSSKRLLQRCRRIQPFKFGRMADHLSAMKSVCDKYGALLVLDEVCPIFFTLWQRG
jgi:hypothetical protein